MVILLVLYKGESGEGPRFVRVHSEHDLGKRLDEFRGLEHVAEIHIYRKSAVHKRMERWAVQKPEAPADAGEMLRAAAMVDA